MVYRNVQQFLVGIRAIFRYPTDIAHMPFAIEPTAAGLIFLIGDLIKTNKHALIYLSRNSIVYICMNQILISAFNKGFYILLPKMNVQNLVLMIVMKCICFGVVMFSCTGINHQIQKTKLKILLGR